VLASQWTLDPAIDFLNHGSFGACPRAVLEQQQRWRAQLEQNPVQFMKRDLETLLDTSREQLAAFLGAEPASLVFVRNTTTGVNAILRSVELKPGDELLLTSHAYNALRNAAEFVAARRGAKVVTAPISLPIESPEQIVESILSHVSRRTRLVLLDHVTCLAGFILPVARLVHELDRRGIDAVIDGAHAPGMVQLNLTSLDAAYYVGNCHKWLCAPKGSAFLYVRRDRQAALRPLVIGSGANDMRTTRSRLHLEFDWTGTDDPTPWLTVPAAINHVGALLPGGWPAVMAHNHALAVEAREVVCRRLGIEPPCREEMMGALAAVLLPNGGHEPQGEPFTHDPLQAVLYDRFKIEVMVVVWPEPRRRLLRLSAHLYNTPAQYARLVDALAESYTF